MLHLAVNPSSVIAKRGGEEEKTSTIPSEELKRLRRRCRQLEAEQNVSTAGTVGLPPPAASSVPALGQTDSSSGAVNVLDGGKLNLRLKEMFKERITCFREAVYLLTGYKVRLSSNLARIASFFIPLDFF